MGLNKDTVVVLKKELIDLIRDRKAILMAILPIILIPFVIFIMQFILSYAANNQAPVGFTNADSEFTKTLIEKIETKNFDVIIADEQTLKSNKDLGLIINIPSNVDELIETQAPINITISQDPKRANKTATTLNIIATEIEMLRQNQAQSILANFGISFEKVYNVSLEMQKIDDSQSSGLDLKTETSAYEIIGFIVPYILIIIGLSAISPVAMELGVGEKEKNTMELLLASKASRKSIVMGKLLAIFTYGAIIITGVMLIIFILTLILPLLKLNSFTAIVTPQKIAMLYIFMLLMMLVLSAVLFMISLMSKTVKEGQSSIGAITMLFVVASYVTFTVDPYNLLWWQIHIPIVNIFSVIKQIAYGIYQPLTILIILGWLIIYMLLAVFFIQKMTHKEKYIFRR